MNPFIPLGLLVLGLAEMVLKDLGVLPGPHIVATIIAAACLVLALTSLYLTAQSMPESGTRGKP